MIEHLHAIMTLDLNKLLDIQLDKNVNEIHEDKLELERAISELDAFSENLDQVIKLSECISCTPWQGADLLVMHVNESSSKENQSSYTIVKTAYPNEVSYVISMSYKISVHFIDYMSKYPFCEMLGNAANEYEGDDLIELSKCVIEAAKTCIESMHQNYINNMSERVAVRQIQMFG